MVDRYDPEGHLLEQYGMLPMMPDFVDPTLFGQDQRNPGWSMAARNPGVPVIMPTDVPTNPNRYLKGARYDQAPQLGEYAPTYESRNPMAPNIPPGTEFSSGGMGMDPALIGALVGGLPPAGVGRGITMANRGPLAAARGEKFRAARDYDTALSGGSLHRKPHRPRAEQIARQQRGLAPGPGAAEAFYTGPKHISGMEPRRVGDLPLGSGLRKPPERSGYLDRRLGNVRMSQTPYRPRSVKDDYRFEEIVTRETPMMVPKPGDKYTRNPYQSEASYRYGDGKGVPLDGRPRSSRGYHKQYMQEGGIRGGYTDDVTEAFGQAKEMAKLRYQDLDKTRVMGESIGVPGSLLGTVLGATLGEGYSELLGEGDTTYSDPTGEERMKLRESLDNVTSDQTEEIGQALMNKIMSGEGQQEAPPMEAPPAQRAKMPARLSRGIKDVIQQREMMMQGAQEQPQQSIYSPLGQTPGPQYQSPYMATSPYEGY